MFRKILTIFSLIGLLISLAAWAASCTRLTYSSTGAKEIVTLEDGALLWIHHWPQMAPPLETADELERRGIELPDTELELSNILTPCTLTYKGKQLNAWRVVTTDGHQMFTIPAQSFWSWDLRPTLPRIWIPRFQALPMMYTKDHEPRVRYDWGIWRCQLPLWMPALIFATISWRGVAPRLRRRKRRRMGLCVECAYDLRGSEHRCPECNAPISESMSKEGHR